MIGRRARSAVALAHRRKIEAVDLRHNAAASATPSAGSRRPLGDLQHRQTLSRQQDDLRPLDLLHGPASVLHDPMKPGAIFTREDKRDGLGHSDRLAQPKRPVNPPFASVHKRHFVSTNTAARMERASFGIKHRCRRKDRIRMMIRWRLLVFFDHNYLSVDAVHRRAGASACRVEAGKLGREENRRAFRCRFIGSASVGLDAATRRLSPVPHRQTAASSMIQGTPEMTVRPGLPLTPMRHRRNDPCDRRTKTMQFDSLIDVRPGWMDPEGAIGSDRGERTALRTSKPPFASSCAAMRAHEWPLQPSRPQVLRR